jgi:hypothetical protein
MTAESPTSDSDNARNGNPRRRKIRLENDPRFPRRIEKRENRCAPDAAYDLRM